jgi:phosphoglycerate dehydrogenase-like enzyme
MDDAELGHALLEAGLQVRLEPKRGVRTPDQLSAILDGAVGAIVSTDPFTADVLDRAHDLRVISRVGVGFDSIDVEAASAHGIQVATTPGGNEEVVADHTLGLMLALLRRIPELERDVRRGGWNRTGRYVPRQLAGATVGLVGCGAIGRLVAERLAGFGVRLLIHDPALEHPASPMRSRHNVSSSVTRADLGDRSTPLDDLLRDSTVVSLHCPLLPSTRHLIDADALRLMRPDAVLINAARGALVDEAALIQALQDDVIAGAALDVFEVEPPDAALALFSMDNVVVSPHIAGLSTVSVAEMTRRATRAVLDVVAGRPVEHLVNHQALEVTR